MKNMTLTIILFLIFIFSLAGYFFIKQFSTSKQAPTPSNPAPQLSPISPTSEATTQIHQCTGNEVTTTLTGQGAAGNIYVTLGMTNTGKTPCSIVLGNTITEMTDAKNVTIHYQQTSPTEVFILKPQAKVYSQIRYPNGPQCSSGVTPQPITFLYKTDQTVIPFQPATPPLMIQACSSLTEKTVINIWPLSTSPITP